MRTTARKDIAELKHRADKLTAKQRGRTVRVAAANARNAEDLALLLDALGLEPGEGRTA